MSQIPPEPARLANADLLVTFMAFPAPLALLDAYGRTERVNTRFLRRFGADGVDAAGLGALIHDPQGGWHSVSLPQHKSGGAEIRARAVRAAEHILVFVDEGGGAAHERGADALNHEQRHYSERVVRGTAERRQPQQHQGLRTSLSADL